MCIIFIMVMVVLIPLAVLTVGQRVAQLEERQNMCMQGSAHLGLGSVPEIACDTQRCLLVTSQEVCLCFVNSAVLAEDMLHAVVLEVCALPIRAYSR